MENTKEDVLSPKELHLVLDAFYEKVKRDDVIGPLFNREVKDWKAHMQKIYSFWDTMIFHTNTYRTNTMEKHIQLHKRDPLTGAHFDRWLALFDETVDEFHQGEVAHQMKTRALSIATMMKVKIYDV